jgi:hypothetical protein
MPGARKSRKRGLLRLLCLVLVLCLEGTSAVAQPCPHCGNSNQDSQGSPAGRTNTAPVARAGVSTR